MHGILSTSNTLQNQVTKLGNFTSGNQVKNNYFEYWSLALIHSLS